MLISKFKKTRRNKSNLDNIIIAVDGPAGAGKSTVAKTLAGKLGFLYLDTGAMYRALTLAALKQRVNFLDKDALIRIARQSQIRLEKSKGGLNIYLNRKLVNRAIRSPLVSSLVSYVAPIKAIRKILEKSQRAMGQSQNCVVEGRDIGTVIFPNAFIKFYVDATINVRAKRRFKELKEKNIVIPLKEIKASIKQRDSQDSLRSYAPLKRAADAIYVDTSGLSIKQVVNKLLNEVLKKRRKSALKS